MQCILFKAKQTVSACSSIFLGACLCSQSKSIKSLTCHYNKVKSASFVEKTRSICWFCASCSEVFISLSTDLQLEEPGQSTLLINQCLLEMLLCSALVLPMKIRADRNLPCLQAVPMISWKMERWLKCISWYD